MTLPQIGFILTIVNLPRLACNTYMTTLRMIRRLLGVGATMHHFKSDDYLWSFSVTSSCVDNLWQLTVQISCWVHIFNGLVCWDCLLRSAIEIIYEINCRDYLWRSALESICWDPCSRFTLSVNSVVETVRQNHFLRLEIEIIYRGQIMRLFVDIDRWNYLLRSTCKISW